MAEPSDEEILQKIYGVSTPSSAESDDEILSRIYGDVPASERRSVVGGMLHQAARGATMGFSDKAMPEETIRLNKQFEKDHPVYSFVGQGVGAVGSMLTPLGWLGKAAAVPKFLLGTSNIAKATAPGVSTLGRLNQYGLAGVKQSAGWGLSQKGPLEETSGDPLTAGLQQVAHYGRAAAEPVIPGYIGGAAGGWAGEKIGAGLGRAFDSVARGHALGANPSAGAHVGVARALREDAPGGDVASVLDGMRARMYGTTSWARYPAFRDPANADLPREIARLYQTQLRQLQPGQTARDAENAVMQALNQRGLVNPGTGQPYAEATVRGWVRAVADDYASHNPVHSYFGELAAQASGGEAPALNTTMRKLLNLSGEGGARSQMLRDLRTRQAQIGPQIESVLERYGTGNVRDSIARLTRQTQDANALYPEIIDAFKAHPDAPRALQEALRPVLEAVRKKFGSNTDDVALKTLEHIGKFEDRIPVVAQGSETPLRSALTSLVRDEQGNVIKKVQRQVPLEKVTTSGDVVTSKINPGGKIEEAIEPVGSLESFIRRRGALRDEADKAYRAGDRTLGHALKEAYNQIDDAVRAMAPKGQAPAGSVGEIMQRWAAANDQRAVAHTLQKAYDQGLGINLKATKGRSLVDLEGALGRFRNLDAPHQEMFRDGIMAQLTATLRTKGDLHDVAKIFSNPRTRDILTEIIGEEATQTFGTFVTRAGLATNTFNLNKGSQTANILDEGKRTGLLESLAGAIYHFNPIHAISKAGEFAGDALKRKKYDHMTRLLSTGTHNPAELEAAIEAIRRAAAPTSRFGDIEKWGRDVGRAGGIYAGRQ